MLETLVLCEVSPIQRLNLFIYLFFKRVGFLSLSLFWERCLTDVLLRMTFLLDSMSPNCLKILLYNRNVKELALDLLG